MAKKSAAFPVGLYGMLLFALTWLTLPAVFAPLERLLVGAACLVPRLTASWFGEPAMAAESADLARIAELGVELGERIQRHDFAGAGDVMPAGDEPLLCGVLSIGRRGGGGLPSELLLDRSYAELAGCREIVTKGQALLGFLLQPGSGRAIDDGPDDPARVLLCHHRDAPRIFAGIVAEQENSASPEEDDGLCFVVRPAATVDPTPLLVDLWNNPYRAARLERAGQTVYTLPVEFGPQRVPGGLLLGRTRLWGYEREVGAEPLTIGVFVQPPFEPRALSHVVLWRARGFVADSQPSPPRLRSRRTVAATVYDLPGQTRGRHLLVAAGDVPDGAAVVQNGLFLGTAQGLAFGSGLVTSFLASRHGWSLLFLPTLAGGSPVELHARVVASTGNVASLKYFGAADLDVLRQGPGYLFTGSNGRFCPAGLWIGLAVPDALDPKGLQVTLPVETGPRIAEVLVGEEDV